MTSGKEDYLKAIYIISEDHELVSNKELSDMLHVSPPSVSEMIMKLQKEGYVDYTAYKGSKMTRREGGSRQAFPFSCVVGSIPCGKAPFSWSEAHEQADGLEHQTSDMLAERLGEFLGHPEHCPHGDPIPKADGSRKGLTFRTLSDLKEGDSTTIRRIVEDYDLMDYLQEKGIHPDMRVTVKEKEPYEGPILLATEAGDISLSYKAVEQIFVDE
ncbi:MAG: metal-dependent transcriptional regulator [Dialister invisus]